MVLGGAGMVRPVKYSLKPFHSHPTLDKMQKKKRILADEPEAAGWWVG